MNVEMRELLEFYTASGVDCAMEDVPQDRFAESAAAAKTRKSPAVAKTPASKNAPQASATSHAQGPTTRSGFAEAPARPAQMAARVPNEEVIASAREQAANAETLDDLKSALQKFEGCNLKNYAKNTVFADGNPEAKVMIIGEAPGRDEDIQGLPFVGRSGQLLDRMFASIGLDRTSFYISNVIPWRPPGNRTPTPAETELCRPFIERQIELVNPDLLVFVGSSSAKTLTGSSEGIMRSRGRWTTYQCNSRDIPAMPIFHPAYLLRQPAQKRLAWQDLLTIKRKLAELS